jgi:hypothetical protein
LENQSCTERSDCDIGSAPSICPKPEAFARWEPVKRRLSSCSGGISISSTSWQILAQGIFQKIEEYHIIIRQLTIDIVDIKFLLIETVYLMFFLFNISKLPTWYVHSFRGRQSALAHGTELVPLGKPSIGLH